MNSLKFKSAPLSNRVRAACKAPAVQRPLTWCFFLPGKVDCGEYPKLDGGQASGVGTTVGSFRLLACENEKVLTGAESPIVVCKPDKTWSDGTKARCTPVTTAAPTTTTPTAAGGTWQSWDADLRALHIPAVDPNTMNMKMGVPYVTRNARLESPMYKMKFVAGVHPRDWAKTKDYYAHSGGIEGKTGNQYFPVVGNFIDGTASPLIGEGGNQVHDLTVHPPPSSDYVLVIPLEAPQSGDYTVDLFGAERLATSGCGDHIDISLYTGAKGNARLRRLIEDISRGRKIPTEAKGNKEVAAGNLKAGDNILFVVHHSGSWDCDISTLRFRITVA